MLDRIIISGLLLFAFALGGAALLAKKANKKLETWSLLPLLQAVICMYDFNSEVVLMSIE